MRAFGEIKFNLVSQNSRRPVPTPDCEDRGPSVRGVVVLRINVCVCAKFMCDNQQLPVNNRMHGLFFAMFFNTQSKVPSSSARFPSANQTRRAKVALCRSVRVASAKFLFSADQAKATPTKHTLVVVTVVVII